MGRALREPRALWLYHKVSNPRLRPQAIKCGRPPGGSLTPPPCRRTHTYTHTGWHYKPRQADSLSPRQADSLLPAKPAPFLPAAAHLARPGSQYRHWLRVHQESGHVQVVDRHVFKDAAAARHVLERRRRRVARAQLDHDEIADGSCGQGGKGRGNVYARRGMRYA